MKKGVLVGAVGVLVAALVVLVKCGHPVPGAGEPAASVEQPPIDFTFAFAGKPDIELLRAGADEAIGFTVTLSAPGYVYVIESIDNGVPKPIWVPAPEDPPFQAGEYTTEGVTLNGAGMHAFAAIASRTKLGVAIESVDPAIIRTACPSCAVQTLTLQKLPGKLSDSVPVAETEQPDDPPQPVRGN